MFLLGPYVLTGACRAKACFSSSLPLTLSCPEPHARDKGLGVVVVSLTMSSSCKDHCNPYLWQLFHMWLLLLLCYPSGTKAFCSEVRNQISGFLFFFFLLSHQCEWNRCIDCLCGNWKGRGPWFKKEELYLNRVLHSDFESSLDVGKSRRRLHQSKLNLKVMVRVCWHWVLLLHCVGFQIIPITTMSHSHDLCYFLGILQFYIWSVRVEKSGEDD